MLQQANVFQDKALDNTKNPFGTIPILEWDQIDPINQEDYFSLYLLFGPKKTKQNADKSKELNNLVLEYKEIEQVSDLTNYVVKGKTKIQNEF